MVMSLSVATETQVLTLAAVLGQVSVLLTSQGEPQSCHLKQVLSAQYVTDAFVESALYQVPAR